MQATIFNITLLTVLSWMLSDNSKKHKRDYLEGTKVFERIQVSQINSHVYLMDDNHEATGYLVVGSKKALVIDTMNGYENVYEVVRTITRLPLMVVNTHGHCDHIFGNVYFDSAYLHPADLPIAKQHMQIPEFVSECKKRGAKMPPFQPIYGGEIIDLGDLHLEIIELPGHTPGGILLLLKEDRILFTGDSINHHLWMQLEESLPMQEFVKNLENLMYLTEKADIILHGHARGTDDISLMGKLLKGAREIAEGKTENDKPYKWFGGENRQHQFDEDGSVICYK